MKSKLIMTLTASVMFLGGVAQGAITVIVKDFTSGSAGIPIVTAAGAAVGLNTIYAQAGIFTTLPTWASDSASTVLSNFTSITANAITNATYTGAFTGTLTNVLAAYATGFSGADAYMVVGNNATLANSTAIAVYHLAGQVFTPTVGGIASVTIAGTVAANWVYGKPVAVTTQSTVPTASYANGIQLTSVPEPSAALLGALGALGLLRRRRI